ncbi:ATP-binding cassette domain-containing protein [Hahella sp. KA22]|uniref:ATP-binding cassette domain-containing protein n=1 Tax=Hahella sp. KA22 TaxID=1628392 RepID=UPI000FDF0A8F|nr:ATP-binding cassette domain-containing protein [Hahella sp. KA22]AZZ93817.1 ATP-binding cassette domain-containing protein [Hahella sp. KA22]QAY57190.1 ATP-binding cassette domain-containing protein [Hahella sp. KA22]
MLEIRALQIKRGARTLHYDLQVAQGEIIALQGVSGVGKSTLLEAIAGFVALEAGRLAWEDKDLTHTPPEQRPVAMLFQDYNLFEHLTVMANLKLGVDVAMHFEIPNQAQALGIADQLEKLPGRLSGGQRQRAALLRTMLRPEPLILLDEPFSELDADTRRLATEWTRTMAERFGKTLLMVTHQREDVSRLAHRAIHLNDAESDAV